MSDVALVLNREEVWRLQVLLQIYTNRPRFMGEAYSNLVDKICAIKPLSKDDL